MKLIECTIEIAVHLIKCRVNYHKEIKDVKITHYSNYEGSELSFYFLVDKTESTAW